MMPNPFFTIVPDFQHLFESLPGLYLVVASEEPYEIVAASNTYLAATMTTRTEILRRSLLDVFPRSAGADAVSRAEIRASLESVVRTGESRAMAMEKFQVRLPPEQGRGFQERQWILRHWPIHSPNGSLRYVINQIEDGTGWTFPGPAGTGQEDLWASLRARAENSEAELLVSRREVEALRERAVAADAAQLALKNGELVKQAEQLNGANHSLRQLTGRLLQIRDEERRRIARDLHDSIGQMLAAQGMYLYSVAAEAKNLSSAAAKALGESTALIKQMSTELRTISYLLHPPLLDEAGLTSALRWYAEGFAERSKIKVSLELTSGFGRLSEEFEIAIFRIVQECLTNIHRHSGSPTASIRLAVSPKEIVLEVRDKGKGMPRTKRSKVGSASLYGVGIRGMQERIVQLGGNVEISSSGQGTAVIARLPVASVALPRPASMAAGS